MLGAFLGYYCRTASGYIALSLTDLTRKNSPCKVQWSIEYSQTFNELKQKLCSSSVLHTDSLDFSKPITLQTHASEWGVGRGMVSQSDEEGQEHPVANFSRKHATIEKECLDVKLGVQYFRVYMLGWPFVVETDHQSLQRLYHMKDNNTRSTRWSLGLQPYVFTVKHWKEKNDGLSQLPN